MKDKREELDEIIMTSTHLPYKEIAQLLIKYEVDINAKERHHGQTVLMEAVMCRNERIVKALLDAKADVNARDNNGRTALMCAVKFIWDAKYNNVIVNLLLEHGADVDATDRFNKTALMYAKDRDDEEKIVILKKYKPRTVDDEQEELNAALLLAIYNKDDAECVKKLLEKGADANTKSKYETTVLMSAAYHGNAEVVELLLKHGADIHYEDRSKHTALTEAFIHKDSLECQINKQKKVIKLLEKHGAKE